MERRMRFVNAIKFDRKSGGAKPRDLQFRGPLLEERNTMLKNKFSSSAMNSVGGLKTK
jgi:hypothetical protein